MNRWTTGTTLFPYTTLFRSKATSSTLYFDSLTVNAGNGGFLHCIQMDTSVNAANQVDRCIHLNADRKSGSAGMPRPISYAVFCLKKKMQQKATSSTARKWHIGVCNRLAWYR